MRADFPLSEANVRDSVSRLPCAVALRPTRVSQENVPVVPWAAGVELLAQRRRDQSMAQT